MRLSTLVDLGWSGKLALMARVMGGATSFYRLAFLAGAARCGALAALRGGPRDPRALRGELGIPDDGEAFDAWLETGVRLGVLRRGPGAWASATPWPAPWRARSTTTSWPSSRRRSRCTTPCCWRPRRACARAGRSRWPTRTGRWWRAPRASSSP